ncbi:MAG: hypothetical protein V2I32_11255 [Desulforhopalus sp.]|jgi:hypothetical protein|nr:hypothetical protein [Desulforhopalus sp.]
MAWVGLPTLPSNAAARPPPRQSPQKGLFQIILILPGLIEGQWHKWLDAAGGSENVASEIPQSSHNLLPWRQDRNTSEMYGKGIDDEGSKKRTVQAAMNCSEGYLHWCGPGKQCKLPRIEEALHDT